MKSKMMAVLMVILICGLGHPCYAENTQHSDVIISEIPAETDTSSVNEKWAGNQRSKEVSDYGAVKPVQVPVEYTGKAIDAFVGGVGKVLSFPFTMFSHKSKKTLGGDHA